jgi:Mn-dependent DtxR family transcriptional regulator
MGTKSFTREEVFLLRLYKFLTERNIESCPINEIVEPLGLSKIQARTIIQTLAHINFVKRVEGKEIAITSNGRTLAENLLAKQ